MSVAPVLVLLTLLVAGAGCNEERGERTTTPDTISRREAGSSDSTLPGINVTARAARDIDSLAQAGGYRSRVVFTPGNDYAVDFLLREFQRIGVHATRDEFPVKVRGSKLPAMLSNVVGIVPGLTDTVVLLCAHMDASSSRDQGWSRQWKTLAAPGAVDNASGVATLLAIARAVVASKVKSRYTLMFAACNAEEKNPGYLQGGHHLGSRYLARRLRDERRSVRAAIVLDMVNIPGGQRVLPLFAEGSGRRIAGELRDIDLQLGLGLGLPLQGGCRRSDNESFAAVGIPTVLIMQSCAPWKSTRGFPRYRSYHSAADLPAQVKVDVIERVARLVSDYLLNSRTPARS